MNSKSICALALLIGISLLTGCIGSDQPTEQPELPDPVTFIDFDVGAYHACGLTDHNQTRCWGSNSTGQLGTGDNTFRMIPWPVSHGNERFEAISLGSVHSCGLSTEREVFCWGANNSGQLGLGDISELQVSVPSGIGGAQYSVIAVGGAHTCALSTTREAYCWGFAQYGQLGTGYVGNDPRPSPGPVSGGLLFETITTGSDHTCALTVGGDAYCWGLGQAGRLGTGSSENQSEPQLVAGGLQFNVISAGTTHTCALALDATAYCWGNGALGQLGTGGIGSSDVPVAVAGGLTLVSISAGGGFTCGVTGGGDAYCWGRNDVGQLGDGTSDDRQVPTAVVGGITFEKVVAGNGTIDSATCGQADNGLVYCWGDGRGGQTGTSESEIVNSPTRVYGQNG